MQQRQAVATQPETGYSEILDVAEFVSHVGQIATKHGKDRDASRAALLSYFRAVNQEGRERARQIFNKDGSGMGCARRISWLQDQIIEQAFDYATRYLFTDAGPLCVTAVGGYGRATLAPGSDIDLLFLLPGKQSEASQKAVEFILYLLWDMGQKVGHATRTVEECIKLSRTDITIRTAILETRYICGHAPLEKELLSRFDSEIVKTTAQEFVAAKLAERDERHQKSGNTRYLVEPNVKEGKGGIRDLHTLFWIAKYVYRVRDTADLVKLGVLSKSEYALFQKAEDFLWAVRCHMHFITGKPEDRLSFDLQPEVAKALGYQSRPGLSAVERFMKHYFLIAKDSGDLTRILCAALEEQQLKEQPGIITGVFTRFANRRRKVPGTQDFVEDRGRLDVATPDVFKRDPVNLIRFFHIADLQGLELHPHALKSISRSLRLINDELRTNEEANRLFLSALTSRRDPALILQRMNEAGVLGRFIPEFGKIVSMMQFNMYHHYTVDEHLIRSVAVLASIEKGGEEDQHPLVASLMKTIEDRETLYVATLLHDIAKGRPEDHSVAGARVARKLCPRFGLTPKQTEMVAWLIEEHLTMSMVAQTRDLNDWKTIHDFSTRVQSLERLKMLIILTVADIRAVGPGVWNGWKGQLLRILYYETELVLAGGFSESTRNERVQNARQKLSEALADWPESESKAYVRMHYAPYLLSVPLEDQVRHTEFIRDADREGKALATMVRTDSFRAITEITVFAPDHPRLLAIIAGACAAAGANIVNAQIFTTAFGRALDTIHVSRQFKDDEDELRRAGTITRMIEDVLSGKRRLPEVIATRTKNKRRDRTFTLTPSVTISNTLSNLFTVIEIECLDRPGLLSDITSMLADLSLDIASARITTFGEKVIDTFYVTDLTGEKITTDNRQALIAARLKSVMPDGEDISGARVAPGVVTPLPPKAVRKAASNT